jgi:predicted ATP-dependent protease
MSNTIAASLLPPESLYRPCDLKQLDFKTTADLEVLTEFVGQDRALQAIQFGVGIRRQGFNLFLLGPAGTGKHRIAQTLLEEKAASEATPDDWCYVNNFENPENPRAMRLPPGRGVQLREDMERLLENLRSAIPSAFESDSYRARKHVIEQEVMERQEKIFEVLQDEAEGKGIAVLRTSTGIVLAPMQQGEVMKPEDFEKLPESEHQKIEKAIATLQMKLQAALHEVPKLEHEGREKIRQLNQEVVMFAIGHLIEEMRKKYLDLPEVVQFLNDMETDVRQNVDQFIGPAENPLAALLGVPAPFEPRGAAFFRRYQVNPIVDHSGKHGAPVIYEDNPTFPNLVGQFEYTAHLGALSTDFSLIRPGALHRANGGYLILDAYKLLSQPYAWEGLKRSLRSSQIRIESIGQMLSLVSTVSLEPQPILLNAKIVLLGERTLYYLLSTYDSEFSELFKVAADFEDEMARNPETDLLYARWIATIVREEKLLPFTREGVARVIEQCSRLAGDSQ